MAKEKFQPMIYHTEVHPDVCTSIGMPHAQALVGKLRSMIGYYATTFPLDLPFQAGLDKIVIDLNAQAKGLIAKMIPMPLATWVDTEVTFDEEDARVSLVVIWSQSDPSFVWSPAPTARVH